VRLVGFCSGDSGKKRLRLRIMNHSKTNRILDKNIDDSNFAKFKSCSITSDKRHLVFQYPNNARYRVSLLKIISWFKTPNYQIHNGRLRKWRATFLTNKHPIAITTRPILGSRSIRLYLSDNRVYDVAWDTVLMGCESRYEWFGGILTAAF